MLRFPNPGSTIENFVAVYTATFEQYKGQIVSLDHIVQATVSANLATSSGHMGQEAITRSTRKDRSRDPLYNQLKMYAELFRSLGWLRSTPESALNYSFTLLGEQLVAAGRQWKPLMEEVVLGIAYPNHVIENRGDHDLRPFSTLLQIMLECNDGLSRDEMIVGPLSATTDRSTFSKTKITKQIMFLREHPEAIKEEIDQLSQERQIQVNTLRNYTRWPIAVMRDLGWVEKDKETYLYSRKKFNIFRLTLHGKQLAQSLKEKADLRIDEVDQLPFAEKKALARYAHFSMMERAGFDLSTIKYQLELEQPVLKRAFDLLDLPNSAEVLFSPFQSMSIQDSSTIFSEPRSNDIESLSTPQYMDEELGRGSRSHLFVTPDTVQYQTASTDAELEELKIELHQFIEKQQSLRKSAQLFSEQRQYDTQTEFYPLVTHLLRIIGFKSDYSRAGVNYQRWDACVWLENLAVPIEVKSPTEEVYLSTKAIRQAIENKVILLSRKGFPTKYEFTSLIIGYKIPNERGDMSMLIDDIYATFKFNIGVIDLETLAFIAMRTMRESVSIDEHQLARMRGFLNV